MAPRVLRKPEYEAARGRAAGAARRGAGADPLDRPAAARADVLPAAPGDPALDQIGEWERQLDEIGEPLPAVELGLRWLRANAPEPASRGWSTATSGSATSSSASDGLEAVIDWELAHLGDPAEDIGWLCIRSWRFGNDELPVAGVGALEESPRRLRGGRRRPVGRRARALLGGVRQRQVGRDLRPPGRTTTARHTAQPRARIARPPDLRAGVGHARAGREGEADVTQDRPEAPGAARGGRRVPVRRAAPGGAGRAALPGPGGGQRLRGGRQGAARRARRRPSRTSRCSPSCSASEARAPTRRARAARPSSRLRRRARRPPRRARSTGSPSTSTRKLDVARPGYTDPGPESRPLGAEREGVERGAAVDRDLLAGHLGRPPPRQR